MNIEAAELAIIAQIKTETGARAESFPEDPEMFVPSHLELVHLVRFESTEYAEPVANRQGVIIQESRVEWVVVSIYRHLTKHGGIYAHLEALRKALTGFTVPDIAQATVLYPVRRSILKEAKGLWYYQTVFAMSHPEAEEV
jgi:hypothetical protein